MKINKDSYLLNAADKLVLLSSKINVSEDELAVMNNLLGQLDNVESFAVQIIKRGVSGLFLKKLALLPSQSVITNQSKWLIEQAYLRTLNRSVLLYGHLSAVLQLLGSEQIEVIVLKGAYLSESIYKEVGLRQFSDLDLLISATDAQKAVELLYAANYIYEVPIPVSEFIKAKSDYVHLPPMVKNGVSIELHVKLHKAAEKYSIDIDKVFKTAISVSINGINTHALDLFHQIIHVSVHAHKHFKEGNVNFTSFSDIANLLLSLTVDFEWDAFYLKCEEYRCTNVVFGYLLLVSHFFELDVVPQKYKVLYQHELNDEFKMQFIRYVKGFKQVDDLKTAIPAHLNNLFTIKNPADVFRYIFDLFFPPKIFMVDKYGIKNEKLYLFYYPYRYLTIFSGLWQMLRRKTKF